MNDLSDKTYRLGVIGCGSGAGGFCTGGTDLVGADLVPSRTDPEPCERLAANTDSVIEVTMNMIAA